MKHIIFILFYFFIFSHSIAQTTNNMSMPAHPRLLVTQNEISSIKERLNHPDFSCIKAIFEKQKAYYTDGISANGQPNQQIRQKMEALALEYLVDSIRNKESGKKAIEIAKNYLTSINKVEGYSGNMYGYEAVFGVSLVYDWCYKLLSEYDKSKLMAEMKRVCCLCEYCFEKKMPKDYLSNHYGEQAPSVFLAIGIATYDENKDFFDFEYSEQVNQFAPSRNPMYDAETHHQGSQYINVRYFNEILQAFILEKIGLNPYSPKISKTAIRNAYITIPQTNDMDGMPDGDGHNIIYMGYFPFYNIAARLSKDPILQSLSKNYIDKSAEYSARAFIYHDPSLKAEPIENLCLSKFFPSPGGSMIARTKWDIYKKDYSSKAMVVMMNMREYNAKNHTHLDVGNFSIYYKGHLAIDAGIYQGEDTQNEWGKLNYVNYYTRTVAHNSILVLDPTEPYPISGWNKKAESRDGGQFSFHNTAWSKSQEMFAAGKSAQIMAEDISAGLEPDYSYLKGDMTKSYNVPTNIGIYPAKVDTVRRSFVFLNLKNEDVPGALIVMDKVVSTNPTFKKSWLLHSQNEPEINKGIIAFESTQGGRNGRVQDEILLPEIANQRIVKIGGVGKEYWVDGKNWGYVTQEDAGRWRIELSPKKESKSDNFLNVIQVMDARPVRTPFVVSKSYAKKGNYIAMTLSNRIVVQQLSLDRNEKEIEFSIGNKKQEYSVLVTDLKAGNWIVVNTGLRFMVKVLENSGTAYFQSKGGTFSLKME